MSLSFVFRVIHAASIVLIALAGHHDNGAAASAGSYWSVPATAAVFSEQKKFMPKNTTQAVELLRFVTAYKRGVEALVDITPYSALLRSASDTDGDLTFFAFIDTWVGNNTPEEKPMMSLDESGKCTPSSKQEEAWGGGGTQGNGWQLDADMIFWPRTGFVDTRPRESITISSGYYGSYSIGSITTHEGTLANGGSTIDLKEGADFTGTLDAEVYPCPGGGKSVKQSFKMGELAKKVTNSPESDASIIEQVYNELIGDAVSVLSVANSGTTEGHVEVSYDPSEMQLKEGMPVWYEKDDIVVSNGSAVAGQFPGQPIGMIMTAQNGKATVALNGTCVPGNLSHWLPRLKMEKSFGAEAFARQLAHSITKAKEHQQDDQIPVALLAKGRERKRKRSWDEEDEMETIFHPFLVAMNQDSEYAPLPILGQVDLGFLAEKGDCAPAMLSFLETAQKERKVSGSIIPGTEASTTRAVSKPLVDGDKVCVLARRANGRVFERTFELPTFIPASNGSTAIKPDGASLSTASASSGDRVLMQFAVTGHGWSGSTEQCGEFCHAVYHINVNGKSAANVTEWRDDCERNPVNGQSGTWEIHRNGWCPGSVEPGLYLDMTKFLNNGRNTISVDLSVWDSKTRQYEKYTDYGSYLGGGDDAFLYVGATMFVYDGAAVDAIKDQRKAYTAAELALRSGCSAPAALKAPHEVNSAFSSMMQMGEGSEASPAQATGGLKQPTAYRTKGYRQMKRQKHLRNHGTALLAEESEVSTESRYNFEDKAPWYNFDSNEASETKWLKGAKVVPAFADGLIQINSREIRVKVKRENLPEEWGHAAMRIKLEKPSHVEGLEMDNWDRMGSLGLVFEEKAASSKDPNSRVKLSPSIGKELTKSWKLAPTRWKLAGPQSD